MAAPGVAEHDSAPSAQRAWCGETHHGRDVAEVDVDVLYVVPLQQLAGSVHAGLAVH